jgi:hypothetical protein
MVGEEKIMPDHDGVVAVVNVSRTQPGTHDAAAALVALAQRAFRAWEQARVQGAAVVHPAVPILFFGDIDAYMQSPLRVITVGLNPSLAEFPAQDPFQRFRAADGLTALASAADCKRYVRALSSYFEEAPYRSWFGTYKGLLEGMDASFYKGAANTALHTDLCSPIATNPTWSNLSKESRTMLLGPGRDLWHDLVRVLRPQVMLISVAREHLDQIRFTSDAAWAELCQVEHKKPYIVKCNRMSLDDGTPMMAIFGLAAQTPFGSVSQEDKLRIGRLVVDLLEAGLSITLENSHIV